MELGATICLPKNPMCGMCPIRQSCVANALNISGQIPHKEKKKKVPVKFEAALVLLSKNQEVWLEQRTGQAFLGGLWKFPSVEITIATNSTEIEIIAKERFSGFQFHHEMEWVKHAYSHFKIQVKPLVFFAVEDSIIPSASGTWISTNNLNEWPLDKVHRRIADALVGQR